MAELHDFSPLPIDENYKPIQGTYRNLSGGQGTVTTAGTAVQLISTQTQAKSVDIKNTNSAANLIFGGSNVKYSTGNGITIPPTFTYRINVSDLSNIWVDSDTNGATFSYVAQW
jgi:hypothetical protein